MQKFLISVLLVTGLLVCLLPTRSAVAADGTSQAASAAHAQCTIDYGPRWCIGYVVAPEVQVLGKPDHGASPVGNYKYRPLEWIAVVEPNPRPKTPDWVRVKTLARPDQSVLGWVRRDQVVLAMDFRRVIGCWPVTGINWHQSEAGEVPETDIELRFSENGQVRELGIGGKPIATDFAIYYARGVFVIWNLLDEDYDFDVTGMLLPDKHEVKLRLELGQFLKPAYTMVDRAKLAGCKEIPVLDPNKGVRALYKDLDHG